MARYSRKDEVDLAWDDNRDQLRLDIRKITRRMENEALAELAAQFDAGIKRGEILELRRGDEALARLLMSHAERIAIEAGFEDAEETASEDSKE